MDIKAMQAEGATKATAWLAQAIPSEERVSPPLQSEPAKPDQTVVPPPEAPKPQDPPVVKPGIAEAIRQDREARARAQAAQTEASKYKTELDTLRKENEQLRSSIDSSDPFEFLRASKLTKEQQALWGQAFLYDLKPEVAPPEFRLDLYKAEQARKEAAQAEERAREQQEFEARAARTHLENYGNDLFSYVQSNPGSSPESEMWFTEDGPDGQPTVNHRAYSQSLLATADNLARRAQQTGQRADLTPANIARVLEAEVSKRLSRRDAKKAGSAKPPEQGTGTSPGQNGKPAVETTTTTSAAGLRGGPPLPPDMSDAARAARAAAVLFSPK